MGLIEISERQRRVEHFQVGSILYRSKNILKSNDPCKFLGRKPNVLAENPFQAALRSVEGLGQIRNSNTSLILMDRPRRLIDHLFHFGLV